MEGSTRGYIIGAGAQGRILAETWKAQSPSVSLVFLDDNPTLQGCLVAGLEVIGPVELLTTLDLATAVVLLAVGDNLQRLSLAERWDARRPSWASVVHPRAVIMPSAQIGNGTVVLAQAVVNSGARVGRHVVVNTGAIVEHDAVIEDGVSLSPGVRMGGRVRVERGAFISTGVTIAPRVRIGAETIVGAGAAVVDDLPSRVLAYGVPARVVRPIDPAVDHRRVL